jgi:hypothetical protein
MPERNAVGVPPYQEIQGNHPAGVFSAFDPSKKQHRLFADSDPARTTRPSAPKPLPEEIVREKKNPLAASFPSDEKEANVILPVRLSEENSAEATMRWQTPDASKSQGASLPSVPKVSLLPKKHAISDWSYSNPESDAQAPMALTFRDKKESSSSTPVPLPPTEASSDKKAIPVKAILQEEPLEYPAQPGELDPVDVPAEAPAAPSVRQASSDPWTLPQPALLQNLGFKTGGWFQGGITFNRNATSNHFNGPLAINDRDSEFQMNQLWLFFDNPVDNDHSGVDIGGRFDMIYGTDWRFGLSHGLESNINSPNSLYGLCLPQIYGELAINRLTIKAGHFATLIGKEQVPSVMNFFYSHDYLMSYSEPLLVTGIENTYALTDTFDVRFGVHRGWYTFEDYDPNNEWNLFGGATLLSNGGNSRLRFDWDYGPQVAQLDQYRYAQALLWDWNLSKRLNHSIQYNWGTTDGLGTWYGIGDWITYRLNKKWAAGIRMEWFHDGGGTRVSGVGNWLAFHGGDGSAGWTGSGYDGDFYELTLGANWTPHPNLRFRPEVRWDWFRGNGHPFGNNDRIDTVTFATDMLLTF